MTQKTDSRTGWQRARRWIVPSLGRGSFASKLRAMTLRIVFWYVVIAVTIAFFQRSLIYLPTRTQKILPKHAGLSDGCVHDISSTTHDNLVLHGWHVLPVGRFCKSQDECDRVLSEGRPLVLFFHGNAGNRVGRIYDCLSFAGMNADVFIFDYRGYGENPGSPSEEALAADARSMWNYATRDRKVAANRIYLYGESLGGGVATRLAAEMCEAGTPPAGLILAATFSSLTDVGARHHPWLPVRLLLLDRFPSVDRISAVTCPILQIHGSKDALVPIEMARKLFAAAPKQSATGVEKRFVELRRAGHNDFSEPDFWNAVQVFFKTIRSAG